MWLIAICPASRDYCRVRLGRESRLLPQLLPSLSDCLPLSNFLNQSLQIGLIEDHTSSLQSLNKLTSYSK